MCAQLPQVDGFFFFLVVFLLRADLEENGKAKEVYVANSYVRF